MPDFEKELLKSQQRDVIARTVARKETISQIQIELRKQTGKGLRRQTIISIVNEIKKPTGIPEEESIIKHLKHTPIKYLSDEEKEAKRLYIENVKKGRELQKIGKVKEASKVFKRAGEILNLLKLQFRWKKKERHAGWWMYYEVELCDHSPPCREEDRRRWESRSQIIHRAPQKPGEITYRGIKSEIQNRRGFLWKTRNWQMKRVR